ncbi:MAG: NAD(P)(+) transhydrogenase (Re/Si-specific) subunit beta, partial [Alphaproteobacteria bacterium]|nr:NAD(P)(+) transhydrogenase (Re/Si-specific) subunit beta [Alphaproteobacteria bacterium]
MTGSLSAFAYLVASFCFIMALRGLSSPTTARRGNLFGIAGMTIAVATTLILIGFSSILWIVVAVAIGGSIGTVIARRIVMTALPQLVAAFHSLVGLAAVFVAAAAFYAPDAFGIGTVGNIHAGSLVEMSLGVAIGAITFTGSIVAFGKLQGLVTGKPLVFAGQHMLNLGLGIVLVLLVVALAVLQSASLFWLIVAISLALGFLIILPIGGADMPVVVSMLNSYSGWAAAGIGFTLANPVLIVVGALVGSSGAILSYIMCKGMNRSFINVILG